ncbi:lysophospholipid acyltransferase 1-like protein [Tanacetum coccineum]
MSVVYVISVDIDWLGSSDGQLGLRGTVVFLHGAPTQSYSYRVVMSQLADVRFQCYVPDWLGFGFSDKPQAGFDGFDYTNVYDRLNKKGKKVDFFQLLVTQTISVVWHMATICPLNLRLLKKIFMLVNFAYTLLVLNYSCVGFMVLSLHETLTAYGSVYYIGTIIPVVEFLLGNVIKTKLARSNAQKEQ